MNAKMRMTNDTISRFAEAMNQMLSRDMSAFFERRIYPMYQQAQKNRWMTENVSEGTQWRELNPSYVKYKKTKYAAYPGKGTKKIIATGKLVSVATGESSGLNKIITPKQFRVAIDLGKVPYAKHVASEFPIMEFGPNTKSKMKKAIAAYIKGKAK